MNRYLFSFLGQHPYWTRYCIGPSSSKTSQSETQQQVAAENGIAVGASTGSHNRSTINVTTDDPEVLEAGLATVQNVADTALNVTATAQNTAATEVEQVANTYAQQQELQTEQENAAVGQALQIAANAAPQTEAAQNEILSGTSPLATTNTQEIPTSWILAAVAVIGLLLTLKKR